MALIGNAAGNIVLGGSVLPATFGGPALVVYGNGLTATDPRWTAALAFAANFSTPLTGVSAPLVGASSLADLQTLVNPWLNLMRRFWSANQINPAPVWVSGNGLPYGTHDRVAYPAFCGPILVMPKVVSGVSTATADGQTAWDWAATVCRSTEYHLYGYGILAVSSITPYLSPPIYSLSLTTYAMQLTNLVNVWKQIPAPTVANYTSLAALELARPGASRYYHPSLLASVLTARP